MAYFTNFINNIKFLFTNNLICKDNKLSRLDNLDSRLENTFHNSLENLSDINGLKNDIDLIHDKINNLSKLIKLSFKNDIVTLNKRIDFIHSKLEKYQVKDIDMMKIYIEENTEKIETIRLYDILDIDHEIKKQKKDINERLEYQQEEIKTLQLFLMEHNHIFRKLKDK